MNWQPLPHVIKVRVHIPDKDAVDADLLFWAYDNDSELYPGVWYKTIQGTSVWGARVIRVL